MLMIDKLLTSIVEVFPMDTITNTIQLDGASSHNMNDDIDI